MFEAISLAGERLLAVVLPKTDAAAGEPVCDPGRKWWGGYCYTSGCWQLYRWCTCNGSGSSYSCYCKRRWQVC